ncbi:histidine kinase [Zobellella taiwanensis]|uniref:histidine kinase n=1 Tax=Zobellella taiwanensis TaxID=347535 RepID=A0A2P7R322_9GAMM|nr:ATP-binding protein [Zobellella taiwanensis]PSJ44596.1 histidine kinase [Zobellella taiwanensis]
MNDTETDARWLSLLEAEQLEQLILSMPSGLLWLDGHGVVTRANPAARALLGEPLQGRPWVEVIARAFAPRPDDGFQVSLHNGRRVQLAIADLAGRPGQLIQLTDITPTRAWAEQQGHAQRLAALGKMAATLAHQIRTPLSAAMLYGANLANPALAPRQHAHFCQRLQQRLADIERQISDILLFARQQQAPLAGPLCLDELLARVVDTARALPEAAGADIVPAVPAGARVLGNANSLQSALLNLVENALQAGAGRVELAVAAEDAHWRLEVRDNGPGMDPALQARAFEPFFTTRGQGTGLGLAAVQSVVQAHQGRVELESAPGRGCCFRLCLPMLNNNEADG